MPLAGCTKDARVHHHIASPEESGLNPLGVSGARRIQARPRIQTSPAGVSANETPHLLSGQRFAAQRPGSPVPMMVARLNPSRDATAIAPVVAYLGWHRRGNLGDDAIYDAVRLQLPQGTFLDLPRLPYEVVRAATTGLNRSLRRGVQVMGGGTLVGTRCFRRLVNRGVALTRNNGSYTIGVGVDDPMFIRHKDRSDNDELKRWAPILSEFLTVSVTGSPKR